MQRNAWFNNSLMFPDFWGSLFFKLAFQAIFYLKVYFKCMEDGQTTSVTKLTCSAFQIVNYRKYNVKWSEDKTNLMT